ncbi:hypothetical protein [Desulfothermobacter acidiphilus]|uniref:hypothetical protein n=1 Tax=Desulfothermobacter acidiphilus TaxID=1938353 RepID=UPI003F88D20B
MGEKNASRCPFCGSPVSEDSDVLPLHLRAGSAWLGWLHYLVCPRCGRVGYREEELDRLNEAIIAHMALNYFPAREGQEEGADEQGNLAGWMYQFKEPVATFGF